MTKDTVSLTKSEATKIASELCDQIEASNTSKESVVQRWNRVIDMFRCDPKGTNLQVIDGLAGYTFPLYRQKANAISRSITSAYFGIKPWVQMIDVSRQEDDTDQGAQASPEQAPEAMPVDDVERTFQNFLESSNLKNTMSSVTLDAVHYNIGICQPQLLDDGTLDVRHVPPKESVLFPCQKSDYRKMITLGHRIDVNRFEVEEGLEDEIYNKDWLDIAKVSQAPHNDTTNDSVKAQDTPVDPKRGDEQIECYELCTKLKLKGDSRRVWYKATVEYVGRQLMALEKLPYSKPWYFIFKTGHDERNMYPSDSIGGICQGLQFAYNDIFTIMLHGSFMTALPPVVISGGSLGSKVSTYQAGQVFETSDDVKLQAIPIQFNAAALPAVAQKIEQLMDGITGISQLGEGRNLPMNTTATAASGFLQGQKEAKDFYVEAMATTFRDMFNFLFELMLTHAAIVSKKMGKQWQINPGTKLDMSAINLQPTGSGATTDPQLLGQKLQALYTMTQNPASSYDTEKVEDAIVESMDFPTDTTKLKKPPPDPNAPMPPIMQPSMSITVPFESLGAPNLSPMQLDALDQAGFHVPPPTTDQGGLNGTNETGMAPILQGLPGMAGNSPTP